MQGPTHRAGGVTAALTGFLMFRTTGVPVEVSGLAALTVLYPFALWGSTCPDLDHSPGSLWDSVKLAGKRGGGSIPSKDPVSRGLSHLLHLTKRPRAAFPKRSRMHQLLGLLDCKHRSWQTHSEVPALLTMFMIWTVQSWEVTPSSLIYQLALTGILWGIVAHLALDLLTPEGLPFATGLFINRFLLKRKVLPERIKIIPHVPPKVKGEPGFFSTGGPWEKQIVYNILHAVNLVLLLWVLYLEFFRDWISLQL